MTAEKRRTTAEDLYRFELVSDPQISPDGQHVVFCIQRVDGETEKKYTHLWVVPTDGGEARQFTYGKQVDSRPRWSPDGRTIAFLSNRGNEEQAQIYLLPFHGGEARPLTDLKGSIIAFEWSPDGSKLAVQFRKKDADVLEREKDEQKKKLGPASRRITRFNYKLDGAGYLPKEQGHIWLVDATSGEATQLTDGDYEETEPRWSPDGRHILFISNRSEDPDLYLDETELYLTPAEGGEGACAEMQQIPAHHGRKFAPAFSPDGRFISYLGRVLPGRWYQNASLYVTPNPFHPEPITGEARNLTAEFDLHLSSVTLGDANGVELSPPAWSADGNAIYCQASVKGNQPLLAVRLGQEQGKMVNGQWSIVNSQLEKGVVGQFSLDAAGKRVAYFWGTIEDPGQVNLLNLQGEAKPRTLTCFNRQLIDEIETGQIEELWFKGPDDNDLHGWILTPPDFDPNQIYPSILQIHGGPQMQYGNFYMHEFHLLAAQGYVVYWSNPRGSQGYGEAHAGAIYNGWGTLDYGDVMAWADYLEQQPYIDRERMGVTGGSYGGYMTATIIGRTDRFAAAVAQRVVSNFVSFYGSSDLNWGTEYLFGSESRPWEDLNNYWEQSPISRVANVCTPTMVIHSENDMRCDREQGEQLFVSLKRLGVDTELILLPGESHGVSRGGRTDRRIARLEHMIRWFEHYLKDNRLE
jgi:dipeptidyl aminopeptidase/acylaminoacyl peptidase